MRITGLVMGILGGSAAGFLGMTWMNDAHKMKAFITTARTLGLDTGEVDKLIIAAYVLLAAMFIGFIGSVLAFNGKGKIAAPLMILAAVAPVLVVPKAFVFTFLLLIGGVLNFLVEPKAQKTIVGVM